MFSLVYKFFIFYKIPFIRQWLEKKKDPLVFAKACGVNPMNDIILVKYAQRK